MEMIPLLVLLLSMVGSFDLVQLLTGGLLCDASLSLSQLSKQASLVLKILCKAFIYLQQEQLCRLTSAYVSFFQRLKVVAPKYVISLLLSVAINDKKSLCAALLLPPRH
jgi:hypothetical protein